VTTLPGALQGALNGLVLWALGVPGAFLWGLLTFLCSFIPNIGYFIAIVPPLFFGFLTGGVPTLLWVIVMYTLINAVVQSVVQPRVVGNAVALSQTITFVSVLVWAVIIGPIGAILAIPLTLLVRAILIDSDPDARWWRPIIGDFTEARNQMKIEDEASKVERKRTRGSR
jgi:AI-2 transport protein TqsA